MNEELQKSSSSQEEVDLLELALKVWGERKFILKACGYAVLIGLVIVFSIPREYTAEAMIAPELSDNKGTGGLSSLAAMAGLNLNATSGADAIYPDLYPDIVSSTPFITGLFNVQVKDLDEEVVTMQDARISACLTDTVVRRLQDYITEYRTTKARQDFQFQEKLFERKKKEYEKAQENYAKFADANKNIILLSYRAEQERLENEMRLAYQVYTSVAQQLQMAEAKVQEITPVYTIIEPATIPIKPSKPRKALMLIGIVFLTGLGCVGWILFGRDFFTDLKNRKEDNKVKLKEDEIGR